MSASPKSLVFIYDEVHVLSIIACFQLLVSIFVTIFMAHLLSRENESSMNLVYLAGFEAIIIRGTTRPESDQHLCL